MNSHKIGNYNSLDEQKKAYVINMRKDLTDGDIVNKKNGKLNTRYFNVKKGQYWSKKEQMHLVRLIILYGAIDTKRIQ